MRPAQFPHRLWIAASDHRRRRRSRAACPEEQNYPPGLPGRQPKTAGIDPAVTAHGLLVQHVLYSSSAFLAGLLPGDRILEVNGLQASHMSYRQAMRALDRPTSSPLLIVVERGGKKQRYTLYTETIASINLRMTSRRPQGGSQGSLMVAESNAAPTHRSGTDD